MNFKWTNKDNATIKEKLNMKNQKKLLDYNKWIKSQHPQIITYFELVYKMCIDIQETLLRILDEMFVKS